MKRQSPLEQKLRMMIIDDNVIRVDNIGKDYMELKIDPDCWGEKYVGLQERYEDIFTIDKALTFQDPGIPRDYWAKFKLRDTKYDLIVLDKEFPGQIQSGREILGEIRKIENGRCPLNARTFVLGYSASLLEYYRSRNAEALVRDGWNALVERVWCDLKDLFAAIDKYLAEEHPEQLVNLRRKAGK